MADRSKPFFLLTQEDKDDLALRLGNAILSQVPDDSIFWVIVIPTGEVLPGDNKEEIFSNCSREPEAMQGLAQLLRYYGEITGREDYREQIKDVPE